MYLLFSSGPKPITVLSSPSPKPNSASPDGQVASLYAGCIQSPGGAGATKYFHSALLETSVAAKASRSKAATSGSETVSKKFGHFIRILPGGLRQPPRKSRNGQFLRLSADAMQ